MVFLLIKVLKFYICIKESVSWVSDSYFETTYETDIKTKPKGSYLLFLLVTGLIYVYGNMLTGSSENSVLK